MRSKSRTGRPRPPTSRHQRPPNRLCAPRHNLPLHAQPARTRIAACMKCCCAEAALEQAAAPNRLGLGSSSASMSASTPRGLSTPTGMERAQCTAHHGCIHICNGVQVRRHVLDAISSTLPHLSAPQCRRLQRPHSCRSARSAPAGAS